MSAVNGTAHSERPPLSFTSYANNSARLQAHLFQIIAGQSRGASSTYHGINPSTEEQLWETPVATQQDLEDAVTAATAAFKTWSRTPIEERRKAMRKLASLMRQYQAEFTELIMKEVGKPRWSAEGEVKQYIETFEKTAEFEIPEHVTQDDSTALVVTRYVPIGVIGAILPWNFPIVLLASKTAGALFAGNTVIAKPSPFAPYSTLKLCELAQAAFPLERHRRGRERAKRKYWRQRSDRLRALG